MKKTLIGLVVTAACVTSNTALAEVNINGFASIKGGMTTGKDDTLYGYTNDLEFKEESLFAVQLSSDLGEKLSVTAQLMAKGANDYDAKFAWAFLSYQLSDNWRLNAGRFRIPFYKYSDYLDVGYAFDWARTPRAVYDVEFDTMDGISFYHSTSIADMTSNIQLVYGAYEGDISVSGALSRSKVQDVTGGSWELSNDWLSARVAYFMADVTINATAFTPLLSALNTFGFGAVAREIDFNEDEGTFFGFGLSYDRNNWVAVTEYTNVKVKNSYMADRDAYFVSVGRRFDSITPYISYEKDDDVSKSAIYKAIPPQVPLLATVAAVVESQRADRDTWSFGMRYDFHPSAAFKVQLSSAKDNYTLEKDRLLTMGVDLVF
ncbi:porin [Rheinheimera sp.]|uniref:porin n=1 Tax=Rheinheimera sp. TaxID=1869214 RepID=UPI003D2E977F